MKSLHLGLRITSILLGLSLIAFAIYNIFNFSFSIPMDFMLPIYYLLFGIIIISAEIPINFMLRKFKYMRNWISRGIFYIFLGTFCLIRPYLLNYILSGVFILIGLLYMFSHCCCRKPKA